MAIEAVLFDWGGVIFRTEHQAPREHLAERLNMTYEDLDRIVFASESARLASVGAITTAQHWEAVSSRLGTLPSEIGKIRSEFFAGDVIDQELVQFIRALRPRRKTGLISNGWPDLRDYISRIRLDDAFDTIVISAEVGLLKPDREIYELVLGRLGVPPRAAALVDDTPANIAAANELGIHGILFEDPAQMRLQLQAVLD